ncbi:MAG: DNA-binding transcriptional ArsR family regulator [Planctomycetota bacterium]|jgi:DNA-binding transcriptional ArsR family regulator/2-polyprenyl-3-methyl-5-hydroxy-6-metoxy-1,4-benzoquinol methylase
MNVIQLDLSTLLKALGDPTRMRILGLLELEELSVGELTSSLGMTQSRVSNHLRVLRDADLLRERRVGTSSYLRPALAPPSENGAEASFPERLWSTLREGLGSLPEHAADRTRLDTLIAQRGPGGSDFFDRLADQWDKFGARFSTGQARQRAVSQLLPPGLVVADLGCGTGYLGRAVAGLCETLICIDSSQGMLDQARTRLESLDGGAGLEFRLGELDRLPLADAEVDGVLAGMVLHHLPTLDGAIAEMRRVLKPGGTCVVLELDPHRETWMQQALGDRHLGIPSSEVLTALRRVGFEDLRMEAVDDRYCPGAEPSRDVALTLYTVRGRLPARS